MNALRIALVAMLTLGATDAFAKTIGPAAPDKEEITEDRRREAIQKYNTNDDYRLKGKELKNFKNERPRMYDNLVAFCEGAKEHPKKNGVVLPNDKKEAKKHKCTKSNIGKAYFSAWARGGETPREEKLEDAAKGEK